MQVNVLRALPVAALVVVAGCAGAGTTPQGSVSNWAGTPDFERGASSIHASYQTRKSLVFEADQTEAAVNIYPTDKFGHNPAPVATIHVARGCPYGMAVDKTGTIYVADWCGGNDVELYKKGSTTLSSTITEGISNPLGLAIDRSGRLYVSNYPPSITEYASGARTPSKTISGGGMVEPFGLALDKSGNLYIADTGASAVFELPAGASSVKNLNLSDLDQPIGVAVDPMTGYLWETTGLSDVINVYNLAKGNSPIKTLRGAGDPYAISIQDKGRPASEVVISDDGTYQLYAYKPGHYSPYATLNNDVQNPTGVLITKP
jgi:hypothetical protein